MHSVATDGFSDQRTGRPRIPILAIASGGFLAIVTLCAVFGQQIAPYDPSDQDLALGPAGISAEHWLGTDNLGRDVFSRVLVGSRTAIMGPLVVSLVTIAVGAALGMVAGFRRGWVDAAVSRFADLVYSLPALLVAVVAVGVIGGGYGSAVAVVTFLSVPTAIRITRSATLGQARLAYVDAATTLGLPTRSILVRHIMPNIKATIVATAMLDFVGALVGLSSLSFLGIGVPPGTADWGLLVAENRTIIDPNTWAAIGPAVALALTAVTATIMGDWLFDRLSGRGRGR